MRTKEKRSQDQSRKKHSNFDFVPTTVLESRQNGQKATDQRESIDFP
jgi:hypothetical protein